MRTTRGSCARRGARGRRQGGRTWRVGAEESTATVGRTARGAGSADEPEVLRYCKELCIIKQPAYALEVVSTAAASRRPPYRSGMRSATGGASDTPSGSRPVAWKWKAW